MKRKITALGVFILLLITGILIPINFVEASNLDMIDNESKEDNKKELYVDFRISDIACTDQPINVKVGNSIEFKVTINPIESNDLGDIYVFFAPQSYIDEDKDIVYTYIEGSASNEYLVDTKFEYPVWCIPSNLEVELTCSMNIVKKGYDKTTLIIYPENIESAKDIIIQQFNINSVENTITSKLFSKLPTLKLFINKIIDKLLPTSFFEKITDHNDDGDNIKSDLTKNNQIKPADGYEYGNLMGWIEKGEYHEVHEGYEVAIVKVLYYWLTGIIVFSILALHWEDIGDYLKIYTGDTLGPLCVNEEYCHIFTDNFMWTKKVYF